MSLWYDWEVDETLVGRAKLKEGSSSMNQGCQGWPLSLSWLPDHHCQYVSTASYMRYCALKGPWTETRSQMTFFSVYTDSLRYFVPATQNWLTQPTYSWCLRTQICKRRLTEAWEHQLSSWNWSLGMWLKIPHTQPRYLKKITQCQAWIQAVSHCSQEQRQQRPASSVHQQQAWAWIRDVYGATFWCLPLCWYNQSSHHPTKGCLRTRLECC